MKQYDYIVVGTGFFGAVFAQQAAEAGRSVLVLEKRRHIGGNCYTKDYEGTNINVHVYGTHIFHTNNEEIWAYITRFTSFNRYQHRVLTTHENRVYPMPICLGTINQFYGLNLRPGEVEAFIAAKREKIQDPQNLEEKAISLVGRELYEAFIKGYTMKQWGTDPRRLPASIITRLPVRSSWNDAYFDDKYQGIPVEGYTPIFERMLKDVPVEYGVDFLADRDHWRSRAGTVVYTGPIDEYFGFAHGRLQWRSVRLETELLSEEDFQGTSVMNYADSGVPFTRIHELKHLHLEKKHTAGKTVIMREFSLIDNNHPYYPVNGEDDRVLLAKYTELAARESGVVFGGRLAEYKYYDMHQAIGSGLQKARKSLLGAK